MLCRLAIAAGTSLALSIPIAALGQVNFPGDPKTNAECDGPALQLRALQDALSEQHRKKYKETEAADFASGGEKYSALMKLIDVQGAERDKLRQEHHALEKACRAAARKNETLAQQGLRELKEGYEKAKRAYDQARAMVERIRNSPADAYAKRNESHSPELESRMNTAKQYILEFQPRSEIVGAIQDASFVQLKSEVQQLNGDITMLESSIQTIRSDAAASTPPGTDTMAGSTDSKPPASRPDTAANKPPDIVDSLQRGVSQAVGWLGNLLSGSGNPPSGTADANLSANSPGGGTASSAPAASAPAAEPAPAPRVQTAGEQCAANAETCNQGCVGVAALGFIGLFTRNNAAVTEAGNQTQICSNRCEEAKNACEQQARGGQPGADRPGSAVVAGNARGLPVDECKRQENASGLDAKLNAVPRNDTTRLLRGAIYNLDFLIKIYTQCLPNPEVQRAINGWQTQREQSIRTCRQISSVDNCLVPPY